MGKSAIQSAIEPAQLLRRAVLADRDHPDDRRQRRDGRDLLDRRRHHAEQLGQGQRRRRASTSGRSIATRTARPATPRPPATATARPAPGASPTVGGGPGCDAGLIRRLRSFDAGVALLGAAPFRFAGCCCVCGVLLFFGARGDRPGGSGDFLSLVSPGGCARLLLNLPKESPPSLRARPREPAFNIRGGMRWSFLGGFWPRRGIEPATMPAAGVLSVPAGLTRTSGRRAVAPSRVRRGQRLRRCLLELHIRGWWGQARPRRNRVELSL